jgi:hypothetical protein
MRDVAEIVLFLAAFAVAVALLKRAGFGHSPALRPMGGEDGA